MAIVLIRAPLGGTFYRTPEPEQPPYVQVDQPVKINQTLGLIEAMKSFNEISFRGGPRVTWRNGKPFDLTRVSEAIVRKVTPRDDVDEGDVLFELEVEGIDEPNEMKVAEVVTEADVVENATLAEGKTPLVEVRSEWVGWYHISPRHTRKPYVQVGSPVKAGDTLCRILTGERVYSPSRKKEEKGKWVGGWKALFLRRRRGLPPPIDHFVKAPCNGILRERSAEMDRDEKVQIEGLGTETYLTLRDGFGVEYDTLLFRIEPVDD